MQNFILFDLDGTLIDGTGDLLSAMNRLLANQDLAPLSHDALEAMLGDGTRMLTKRAFEARNCSLSDPQLDHFNDTFVRYYTETDYEKTVSLPGAKNALLSLAKTGWKIGLASNKPTKPCQRILQRLGVLDLFGTVIGGDLPLHKKPHADHIIMALQKLGFTAKSDDFALMVGDHDNDINSAHDAGIPAIAIDFAGAVLSAPKGAEATIRSYDDILKVIRQIKS